MHGINIVRTGVPVSLEECNVWFDRDSGGKSFIGKSVDIAIHVCNKMMQSSNLPSGLLGLWFCGLSVSVMPINSHNLLIEP